MKNKNMEKINKFLEPTWRKIALVVLLTVITYASVSQTILQLNKQSRAADVCYNSGEIPINNPRNLANTINTYISTNRSGSAFSAIPDVGMVFVQAAIDKGVNPLYLLGIAENETALATATAAPSMAGGNPFGRRALTTERSFCTGLSDTCDAANRWYVYPGGYTTSMINDQAQYLSQNPNYGGASSTAFTSIIGTLIAQAGSAVSCSVATTTTASSTTNTTVSATPSCAFNPTSYSTPAGTSVILGYSTVNATSAEICSAGGTCAATSAGANRTFTANPTASTTYTLTVRNTAGTSRTCTASVSVTAATTTTAAVPACSFSPGSYTTPPGIPVNLGYSTTNATSAEMCSSGGTCKATAVGSGKVFAATPTSSVTYTLTVRNSAGTSRTCTTSVAVPSPSCAFNPATYSYSTSATKTMYYSTNGATSATIASSGGTSKPANVGALQTFTAGALSSTTYTMTVRNAYGTTATCTASMSLY